MDDLMAAADLHNLGNSNESFFSAPVDNTVNFVKNTGYAIAATTISGANGLWNTGASIGNFFGADLQVNNAHAWMSNIDSDLDKYYMQHQQGIDAAGFVLGSFVPGALGVKVLKAGQLAVRATMAGWGGTTAEMATGLLAPALDTYRATAAFDIAKGTAQFSAINQNVLKAIGSGFLQNTLEAGAFETFSTLAQFKSPILADKDAGDIAKDMLSNTLFGGAIGGLFSTAKTFYGIKNAVGAVDKAINTHFNIPEFTKLTAGEQAVNYSTQLRNLPAVPAAEDFILGRVPGISKVLTPAASMGEATGQQLEQAAQLVTKYTESRTRIATQLTDALSGKITTLAGGDSELGRLLINGTIASPAGADGLLDTMAIKRLGQETTSIDRNGKLRSGAEYSNYVQLFGDEAGTQSLNKPQTWRLADSLDSVDAVNKYVTKQGFSLGKSIDYSAFKGMDELTANARNIWAAGLKEIPEGTIANVNDVPLLKRALELNTPILVRDADGFTERLQPRQLMGQIQESIDNIRTEATKLTLAGDATAPSMDQLAHRLDVSRTYLEGTASGNAADDIYASRTESEKYTQGLIDTGVTPLGTKVIDTSVLPKFAAVQNKQRIASAYATADTTNEMLVTAQASVLARAQVAKDITRIKLADVLGSDLTQFAPMDVRSMTRYGTGHGFLVKPNSDYMTAPAVAQHSGLIAEKGGARISDAVKKTLLPDMDAVRTGWLSDSEKLQPNAAAITPAAEVSAVFARAQKAGEQYVPFTTADGQKGFTLRSVVQQLGKDAYKNEAQDTELLTQIAQDNGTRRVNADAFIPVKSEGAWNLFQTHIAQSNEWLTKQISLDASRGIDSMERYSDLMGGLYVPKPNPQRFPFYAFVTDSRLAAGSAGRTTMIHASTEAALTQLMDRVKSETAFTVRTRDEAERFYKGQGTFDYEQTMNHSYVDQDLQSKGIMSPHFVQTNPDAVVDDLLSFHTNRAVQQYREGIQSLYGDEFEQLRKMEQPYTDTARSTSNKNQPTVASGPAEELIRTAVGLPKFSPLWNGIDDAINNSARNLIDSLGKATAAMKGPTDLDAINNTLAEHGVQTAYQDAALYALVNHPAGLKPVTRFVRAANATLSTLALGWDALNGVNNAVGATILRSAELKYVLDSVRAQNPDAVSKLAEISSDGISMLSPAKMQALAYKEFLTMGRDHPWYQQFRDAGYIKDAHEVQMQLLSDGTLNGTESVKDLLGREASMTSGAAKLAEIGRTITGNNYMERMNRFVSAHVAKQVTELGISEGVIGQDEAQTIISTFVNRTEGTLAASQRPVVFNGALGGAIGLFQSYQFNLMQQLLRYVGDGQTKAAAYALGMQSTMYGLNGLPGFQQLNQHIIGTMSTNPQHRDAYDATFGALGKQAGDLLLYGAPSNIMQTNLYSRGDINPRYATILPTSIADVPIVGMLQKTFSMVKGMAEEAIGTGNIGHAILTGLEENGVNRPLAGIATLTKGLIYQNGKVIATSKQGVDNVSSELYSISQLARLAGGRPLDEATALDGLYRIAAFNKTDTDEKATLTENLRNASAAGNISTGLVNDSLKWFVQRGKTQREFSNWMMDTQKGMAEDQVSKVAANLKAPYGYKMQLIMGGQGS